MSTTVAAPAADRVSAGSVLDRAVLDRAAAAMSAKRRVEVEVVESALAPRPERPARRRRT